MVSVFVTSLPLTRFVNSIVSCSAAVLVRLGKNIADTSSRMSSLTSAASSMLMNKDDDGSSLGKSRKILYRTQCCGVVIHSLLFENGQRKGNMLNREQSVFNIPKTNPQSVRNHITDVVGHRDQ